MSNTARLTTAEVRAQVIPILQMLKDHIGGAWPLREAFTDLDDHPEEDEHGGFNYNVGFVRGLCEAVGLDPVAICDEVDDE